jgi:protein TonB
LCYDTQNFSRILDVSSAFFVSSSLWRSGIFAFVACAHALFLTALSLAKTPPKPPIDDDKLIMVEMLPMAAGPPELPAVEPEPPAAQPVVEPPPPPPPEPVKKPPVRPRKLPVVKAPTPPAVIEETASNEPAGAATPTPVAEAPEVFGHGAPGNVSSIRASVKSGSSGSGGDSAANFDADYLRNPKPPYPPISRRMREEGRVVLRVRVTADGGAGDVEVSASSGSTRLDEAALRTVRQWKFIPARRGQMSVQSWVLVPVTFKLES